MVNCIRKYIDLHDVVHLETEHNSILIMDIAGLVANEVYNGIYDLRFDPVNGVKYIYPINSY